MIKRKPEGLACYRLRLFEESIFCPDYAEASVRLPQCKKYSQDLSWTVSGAVLKCQECLAEEAKKREVTP